MQTQKKRVSPMVVKNISRPDNLDALQQFLEWTQKIPDHQRLTFLGEQFATISVARWRHSKLWTLKPVWNYLAPPFWQRLNDHLALSCIDASLSRLFIKKAILFWSNKRCVFVL